MIKAVAAQMKISPDAIRAAMSPQELEGTVRYRVTVALGGAKVRVRISNEDGATPLQLDAASIAQAGEGFSARAGSLRSLTFSGARGVTIPAGAPAVSDPVDIGVAAGSSLIVSAKLHSPYLNDKRGGAGLAIVPGDQTMVEVWPSPSVLTGRPIVSGVEVLGPAQTRVIVTFGDSITDGNRAAAGVAGSWPAELARRLGARAGNPKYTVVNAGIGGNRLLAPGWGRAGLARLDRDALRIEGISHLIILEGVNDIGMAGAGPFGNNPEITAADLISGYRQMIARARARGVKVIIGTITPTSGSVSHSSPSKDAIRAEVNNWIRSSGEADGVIDFEAITRDPAAPQRFRPEYDSGDHLHPNDAGYKAMGEGIDLRLFGG